MSEPSFNIAFDPDAVLLNVTVQGYWDRETLEHFVADITDVAQDIRARFPRFSAFCDSREFEVQAPEIVEAFAEVMQLNSMNGGRAAILVKSVLVKLQAQRIFTDPAIAIFRNEAKARSWICKETRREPA